MIRGRIVKTRTTIFWILWISSFISAALLLPYLLTLESEVLKNANMSASTLILIALVQAGVIFGIAAFAGLILAEKTGFQLPLLSSWLEHKKIEYKKVFWLSVILGLATGIIITLLDYFVFQREVASHMSVPLWQGFLACFYGGIAEEIIMRLFLMSLAVFILMKISRRKEAGTLIVWSSIILVAILFGLGHLPITASAVAITPMVVFRAILLNGIGGVVFGWLYWKKGLESAIIAHFSADIVLQVIAPALLA
jgi:membrane protease YdiL (CAAX protease family)